MHFMGCDCFQFYYSYVQKFLGIFSRFRTMEIASDLNRSSHNTSFGHNGLCAFGFFKGFWNWLALLILFGLGVKVLRFSRFGKGLLVRLLCEIRRKSNYLSNGFCSASDVDGAHGLKNLACKNGASRFLEDSISSVVSKNRTILRTSGDFKAPESSSEIESESDSESEGGGCSEEYIPALKRLLRIEKARTKAAQLELEKERTAAASAAEETMAMIQRLQKEKNLVEMQAKQFRKLAEQKQLYDQEVIECLRSIILKHESDRSLLESQLNLCSQKLKQCLNLNKGNQTDDIDHSLITHSSFSADEDDNTDMFVSSLEMDSGLM
ncbi:hypothetical protein NE237_019453 [Protea cynaroides]|uniref:GTD-binding domain-containing protein n=1 Tax=Protea cynaroides TaxID=273540 RepID=A0A9Q0QQ49_9MAGN|nr:hypothetical protein NE237_019453 [Protea cynaroides]